ncbi:phage holin family protein [Crenobacter cavernae]|uniref:Phage holin family protein n=1 Tax=Crenobacter cavernae TaxID=2290923 RepID=A0ABY0FFH5_9NEIS|nr:phage holin family protein [Crenobacter cavernae]RXZ45056.1 phage holin family protein [Crenobacter cavernae]
MSTPRPGSLRSLLNGFVSLALTRAELFGIEAHEQQERMIGHLVTGVAAMVALLIGLIAFLLFVMVITPDDLRAAVLGALASLFLVAGAFLLWWLKRRLALAPAPFSSTLTEVRRDWQTLSGRETP